MMRQKSGEPERDELIAENDDKEWSLSSRLLLQLRLNASWVARADLLVAAPASAQSDQACVAGNIRFHMCLSDDKPKFGRYDHTQKAEYWAVVWGTIIMVFTGFVLWFPEEAVKTFPSMIVTASQTIHFYEAWLAALAIIVWHLFFVTLHPDVYPMSWTWLIGKMPLEAASKHHGRWLEQDNSESKEEAADQR